MMKEHPAGPVTAEAVQTDTSNIEKRILDNGKRIGELLHMSPDQLEEAAIREHQSALKSWLRSNQKDRRIRASYTGMLEKVEEWTPPTPDHEGLKDYMKEQLEGSLTFDCAGKVDPFDRRPIKQTGGEYRESELEAAHSSLEYAFNDLKDTVIVSSERVKWVEQLQASLEPAVD